MRKRVHRSKGKEHGNRWICVIGNATKTASKPTCDNATIADDEHVDSDRYGTGRTCFAAN